MVSRADEQWGVRWEDLAELIRCYALGDVKHGHLVWTVVLGCLLRVTDSIQVIQSSKSDLRTIPVFKIRFAYDN